uniref:Uncharacterized protein n=1 Tax=Arundo donax TaxID=35708 RepID=A0A0A9H4K5_ARUDO
MSALFPKFVTGFCNQLRCFTKAPVPFHQNHTQIYTTLAYQSKPAYK